MPRHRPKDLQEHAEALSASFERAVQRSSNELELRLAVEPDIRAAIAELYSMNWEQIRSERVNTAGRYDTSYGGVIVEYEYKMTAARRKHGSEQGLAYLAAERDRLGPEQAFTAIVTDGRQWGFLLSDVLADDQLQLFGSIPADPSQRFVWQPHSIAACRRFLELIGTHRKAAVSGDSLSRRFGSGSDVARETVSLLVGAVANRDKHSLTDTLYSEWRRALEVAYGTLDDASAATDGIRDAYRLQQHATLGETLFGLHTYFALVARLVALEVLAISSGDAHARPSLWVACPDDELAERLRLFELGKLPRGLGVANLLEGDVFSWYLD